MPPTAAPTSSRGEAGAACEVHLLGRLELDALLALQRRMCEEAAQREDDRIAALFCELPPLITAGRSGSRIHVRLTGEELRQRGLAIRWVSRGGGCVLHGPGQLVGCVIAPLARRGWTVGEYRERLRRGVGTALAELGAPTTPGPGGLWGRSGLLAAFGVAVREQIAAHGFFLNVAPVLGAYGFVDSVPADRPGPTGRTTMGSLLAETRQPARIARVRTVLATHLAEALDCPRLHIHTGRPRLPASPLLTPRSPRDSRAAG